MAEPMILYNLFPRLAGRLDDWLDHARRVRTLGFTWLFLNPVQLPGLSGSLYSVKDHRRINPEFLPPGTRGDGYLELRRTLAAIHDLGLKVMVDLVVNHTAIDAPLITAHPDWFRWVERNGRREVERPFAVDPNDPTHITVWGDLAEVDNESSPDQEGLYGYWEQVVSDGLELGFDGYRCDAAYKVPGKLWRRLIGRAKNDWPEALFAAETLGCTAEQAEALQGSGFDLLFNSSRWWQFDAPWAVQQHERFRHLAPSISFPESHDTERLTELTGGLASVQRQRYAFAAAFSAGVMIPIGYEYGFSRRLHVVETRPAHWEQPTMDLSDYLRRVNGLKTRFPLLAAEGRIQPLTPYDRPTLVLAKEDPGGVHKTLLILINKDWHQSQELAIPAPTQMHDGLLPPLELHRLDAGRVEPWPVSGWLRLEPAEVVYALPRW